MIVVMMMAAAMLIVVVMVAMLMLIVVVMMAMFMLLFFLFLVAMMVFKFINPGSRCSHFVEVEHSCVYDAVEVDVAIVARHDNGLRLYGVYYLYKVAVFLGAHFRCLVKQNDVTELNLLDYEVLKSSSAKSLFCKASPPPNSSFMRRHQPR